MATKRHDGRRAAELRPIEVLRSFTEQAAGSVLFRAGKTHVLCTASWVMEVPKWRAGSGKGWLTAEYDMLPGATPDRRSRNRDRVDGRTVEIQRLIGRALRAVVDLTLLGERSIYLDCDVLQADGGTRTASVSGAYIALADAVSVGMKEGWIEQSPIVESVAAVSVGRVDGKSLLDLDYVEDSQAEVDMNVVMTGRGKLVEVQATAEGSPFDRADLDSMLTLASKGIRRILAIQRQALGESRK